MRKIKLLSLKHLQLIKSIKVYNEAITRIEYIEKTNNITYKMQLEDFKRYKKQYYKLLEEKYWNLESCINQINLINNKKIIWKQ